MTSTDIEPRRELTPAEQMVDLVRSEQFRSQLEVALPEGMRPERFIRGVATALLENSELADPSKYESKSVFQAILKSAQDGLVPDGREAALVPFKPRDADVAQAQYLPMVGGLRKIAAEYGWTLRAQVVYANDEFEIEQGTRPRVRHVPTRPGADRGDPIAAYSIGSHPDGRVEVEMMTVEEIEKVRSVSRAKDRGPWRDWWDRMAEKTVARRLFKKLPLGDRERIERVLEAARMEPADAAAAMYGPNGAKALASGESVDTRTGEISSATPSADENEGRPAVAPEPQQAGEAEPQDTASSSPSASSVPEDDDPEPVAVEPVSDDTPAGGEVVVTVGAYKGRTLAEIAAMTDLDPNTGQPLGDQWLKWAARRPDVVGPEVHAALQRFRGELFDPKGA